MGTVVGGKEDNRLAFDPEFSKELEDAADVSIHPGNHSGTAFFRFRPGAICIRPQIGHFHSMGAGLVVRMGDSESQVEEERPFMVAFDETERLFDEEVMAVVEADGRDPAVLGIFVGDDVAKADFGFVPPEVGGIVVVGVVLVEVTEEFVKSLSGRDSGGSWLAKAPFPDQAGDVAGAFEPFGNGSILRTKGNTGSAKTARLISHYPRIASDPAMSGM